MPQTRQNQPPKPTSSVLHDTNIKSLLHYIYMQDRLMLHLGLRYPSMKTFAVIAGRWTTHRRGITIMEIQSMTMGASDNLQCIKERLRGLTAKGLIAVIGETKNGAHLYAPTLMMLEKIEAFMKLL